MRTARAWWTALIVLAGTLGSVDAAACFPDPSLQTQCAAGMGQAVALVGIGAIVGGALAALAWVLVPRFHRGGRVPRKAQGNKVVPRRV